MLQEGNINKKDDDDHDDDYGMTKVLWTGRHLYLVLNENVDSCPVNTKYLCTLAGSGIKNFGSHTVKMAIDATRLN